jgi:hypothetical protein
LIHEHEPTQIASAGIDFALPPEVVRELEMDLRDCPVCAERAASYHEQIRLMRRLPVLDASEATRQRVTAAALRGSAETRSPMLVLLAAALLVGLLLALTAAAGALLNSRPPQLTDAASPEPSRPVAGLVSSAPSPPSSGDLTGGSTVFPDALAADSIANVVSGNLRVRSKPAVATDSVKYEPLLQAGDRLFVVEGPVVANDYDWYRVVPIGSESSRPTADLPSGWVSRGDHDATPWIVKAEPDCPAVPVEIGALNAMHPLERLACFGNAPLSFDAVIEGGAQSGWIADSRSGAYLDAAVPDLEVALAPGAGLSGADLPSDRAARLEGAFDDSGCAGDVDRLDRLDQLDCRTTFTVSRAVVDSAAFDKGTLAMSVTDGLRVRERPLVEDAGKLELLSSDTRAAVVGGPAVGSGYVWYQVAVPSIRASDGGPRVGWVAAHGKDGEPWLGGESTSCPAPSEVTLGSLAALTSAPIYHGGLACYGASGAFPGATLTVQGHVSVDCSGPPSNGSHWLMDRQRSLRIVDGRSEASAAMSSYPDSIPCDGPLSHLIWQARGHFDDDEASSCRANGLESSVADLVSTYECRARFVVTELFVAGPGPTPLPGAP